MDPYNKSILNANAVHYEREEKEDSGINKNRLQKTRELEDK